MLKHDDRLRFGVCWYPDQWPKERWSEDVRLMRNAGLDCVRWGEGSWTSMQPERGRFEWSLVDEVLDLCARNGLGVILGTPTYAAPAWLEEMHPEIIARRESGAAWYRHSRRYYDYTQPAYRAACDEIVRAMAARYAGDERVWAWQLDNEMWCHLGELWGDSAKAAFQRWLARRYENIAALNDAWGLAFWSNQLDHFGQADLPGPTTAYLNHHQCADYRHFLSDLAIDFIARQRELIVAEDPSALVLHNCPFGPIDRARLLEGLDIYGHDHYPRFAGAADERPAMGLNYGRFRAYAKRLWVVEQQASQVGQTSYRLPAAPPGELSVTALQSIGHGCNLLSWFRWRSFPAAQETNWGGLLPHWGAPGRHYDEARALITALGPHAELIASTSPEVSVARLVSYRQQVAADVEPWIGEHIGGVESGRRALRRLGLNEDTLRPRDLTSSSRAAPGGGASDVAPGARYALALLPLAVALDEADLAALAGFVRAGGTLIVGPLAGHRCAQLQGPFQHEPPGALRALTGTANGDTTTLDEPARLRCRRSSASVEATRYAEILEKRHAETEVLAEHARGWFAGSPAVTRRRLGSGSVIHCGVALNDDVLTWLWREHVGSGVASSAATPAVSVSSAAAEVLTRRNRTTALHFLINHGPAPASCERLRPASDLIDGTEVPPRFELPGYGYRILREGL